MAWFGAGTVGRVGCLCNAGPGWQLENSLNSLNSSHFFLNVRERIETTSAILPSTTNNYKGSTTSGVFFLQSLPNIHVLSPCSVCLSLSPEYVRNSQEPFLASNGPLLPSGSTSQCTPGMWAAFLCSLSAFIQPEIECIDISYELQPVPLIGHTFCLSSSNSTKKRVTSFKFF